MMLGGLGHRPDPVDPRDRDARSTLLRAVSSSPAAALNADLAKTLNQGQLGSCVLNTWAQMYRAAELLELVERDRDAWALAGNDPAKFDAVASLAKHQAELGFPSRLFPYFLCRSYTHETQDDTGTELRLAATVYNKYGVPPESAWPYSDDTSSPRSPFRQHPSAEAFRLAYDARASAANQNANLIDYARITTSGARRVEDIKIAIAARHFVGFGTPVTEQFCSDGAANGGRPIPRPTSSDQIADGHAMTIIGYDQDGAIVQNSWGEDYGGTGGLPTGCLKMGWDYITWDQSTDFWICRRAPLLAEAA